MKQNPILIELWVVNFQFGLLNLKFRFLLAHALITG